jgi:hypothetical protein
MIGREVQLRKSETEFVLFFGAIKDQEEPMSEALINLIIQLIAGALARQWRGQCILAPWATRSRARSAVWPVANFLRH